MTRTPAPIARSSAASALVEPLSEMRTGGVPARSASSSSVTPNTSQPRPSASSTRRSAVTVFALIDGSASVGPAGQAAATASRQRAALPRSWRSEITYSGVPKRSASSEAATASTCSSPAATESARSLGPSRLAMRRRLSGCGSPPPAK